MKHSLFTLIMTTTVLSSAAHASVPEFEIGGQARIQGIFENNRDLDTRDTNTAQSLALDVQPDLKVIFTDEISAYVEGRFVKILGDDGVQDDDGQISAADQFAELREAWVNFDRVFDIYPLSVKVGHQRIREDRNLFWNDDLDAIKISYDTTRFKTDIGVINNFAAYRSSDEDYLEDDEKRFRAFAQTSWLYKPEHRLEFRGLYENDYSGRESIGDLVVSDNRDDTDYDLFWTGIRATGDFIAPAKSCSNIRYRADLIGVFGEETVQSTAATADPMFRSVTGHQTNDVRAWALDAGVDIKLNNSAKPVLTLNYAYGSGDDDPTDGTNTAYRDSDMNGYTSRYGAVSKSIHNYGEAYRPDLSNIHVLTAGIGMPVFKSGDASLFYHHYIRDDEQSGLGSTRVQASPNNTDNNLGQEIDFAFNIDLQKQFERAVPLAEKTRFSFTSGVFLPGDAYNVTGANDDPVVRIRAELSFKF